MYKIGVDIGGTTAKIGLFKNNNLLEKQSVQTYQDVGPTLLLIKNAIKSLMQNNGVKNLYGIGIGAPGSVTKSTKKIEFLSNLGWSNVEIGKYFELEFNTKVEIANDADSHTIAEMKLGSGKNYNNFLYITIGTGVGGGIVINKKLYGGSDGKAGEIGHMVVNANGLKCNCGRRGCFERYASATALIEIAKKHLKKQNSSINEKIKNNTKNLNGKVILDEYKNGDKIAQIIVDEYVKNLGEGLLSLMNILRPEAIVIGGGIGQTESDLIERIKKYVKEREYGYKGTASVEIEKATFYNDAGIIGASLLVD